MHSTKRIINGPFQCEACYRDFATESNVKRHREIHMRSSPYMCWECEAIIAEYTEFLAHRELSHEDKSLFRCDPCKRVFSMKFSLKAHKRRHSEKKKRLKKKNKQNARKKRRLLEVSSITESSSATESSSSTETSSVPETPSVPGTPIVPEIPSVPETPSMIHLETPSWIRLEAPTLTALLTQKRPNVQVVYLDEQNVDSQHEMVITHEDKNPLIQPSTSYQYAHISSKSESLIEPAVSQTMNKMLVRSKVLTNLEKRTTKEQTTIFHPLQAETQDKSPLLITVSDEDSSREHVPSVETSDFIQSGTTQSIEDTIADRQLRTCDLCTFSCYDSNEFSGHLLRHFENVSESEMSPTDVENLISQSSPLITLSDEDNSRTQTLCDDQSDIIQSETLQSTEDTIAETQLQLCDVCPFSSFDSNELSKHLFDHLENESEVSSTVVANLINQSSPLFVKQSDEDNSRKQTPCDDRSNFIQSENLQITEDTTAERQLRMCDVCSFSSYDPNKLSSHLLSHFGNESESEMSPTVVGKLIEESSPLIPIQSDDNSEEKILSVEPSEFIQAETLQNAEHATAEMGLYTCNRCPFSSYNSDELEKHMMGHQNEE